MGQVLQDPNSFYIRRVGYVKLHRAWHTPTLRAHHGHCVAWRRHPDMSSPNIPAILRKAHYGLLMYAAVLGNGVHCQQRWQSLGFSWCFRCVFHFLKLAEEILKVFEAELRQTQSPLHAGWICGCFILFHPCASILKLALFLLLVFLFFPSAALFQFSSPQLPRLHSPLRSDAPLQPHKLPHSLDACS